MTTPRAPRLIPSRLLPLAPETLQCNVSTGNPLVARLAPLASSPHASSPLASRLLPLTSRLAPLATAPAAGPGAAPLRPSTLSSHVQRATFNLQPLSPLAPETLHCNVSTGNPLVARRAPLHVVVPRSTCNVQPSTPPAPRLLPARLARDCATKPSTEDRKPVSPRIAIRRQPMRPGCRGSPAPVPRGPTLVPGSAVPFPTRQRAAASARVAP